MFRKTFERGTSLGRECGQLHVLNYLTSFIHLLNGFSLDLFTCSPLSIIKKGIWIVNSLISCYVAIYLDKIEVI